MSEVSETGDFVDAEGDDFEVGHFFENGQIFELVSPKIKIFDALQVVGLGLRDDYVKSELFANTFVAHFII